jgi:3-(methylthio)propionyl---CoA ligase
MQALMMNDQLTLGFVLDYAEQIFPTVSVTSRGFDGAITHSTWSDVAQKARRIAQLLSDMGIQNGDRVATLALNHADHLAAVFAISGIGAVCHTINPRLSVDDVAYLIDHANDSVIFFDPAFQGLLSEATAQSNAKPRVIAFGDDANFKSLNVLIAGVAPLQNWTVDDERAACALCYTSGTTGRPKGVLYSHRSAVLHAMSLNSANGFGIGGQDVVLPLVPLFHACAWGMPFAAAMAGAALALPGHQMDGRSVHELITAAGVTVGAGVPTVWATLLDYCRSNSLALGTLRLAATGGAAPSRYLIEQFERECGIEVYHGWGMTEVSPLGTTGRLFGREADASPDEKIALKLTQGYPAFGIQMRLVDDDGISVGEAASGHLQVRGPWVCADYYAADIREVSHTDDGWFKTGDIARFDSHGRLVITDRAKDVIKSGGEWISSMEIEAIALGIPQISHAAAIGVPDPKWDERPMLFVVLGPGMELDEFALRDVLTEKLPRWQVPDRIEFVTQLPLGATGKVLKAELRRQAAKTHVSTI